jgi:hypothetical protein
VYTGLIAAARGGSDEAPAPAAAMRFAAAVQEGMHRLAEAARNRDLALRDLDSAVMEVVQFPSSLELLLHKAANEASVASATGRLRAWGPGLQMAHAAFKALNRHLETRRVQHPRRVQLISQLEAGERMGHVRVGSSVGGGAGGGAGAGGGFNWWDIFRGSAIEDPAATAPAASAPSAPAGGHAVADAHHSTMLMTRTLPAAPAASPGARAAPSGLTRPISMRQFPISARDMLPSPIAAAQARREPVGPPVRSETMTGLRALIDDTVAGFSTLWGAASPPLSPPTAAPSPLDGRDRAPVADVDAPLSMTVAVGGALLGVGAAGAPPASPADGDTVAGGSGRSVAVAGADAAVAKFAREGSAAILVPPLSVLPDSWLFALHQLTCDVRQHGRFQLEALSVVCPTFNVLAMRRAGVQVRCDPLYRYVALQEVQRALPRDCQPLSGTGGVCAVRFPLHVWLTSHLLIVSVVVPNVHDLSGGEEGGRGARASRAPQTLLHDEVMLAVPRRPTLDVRVEPDAAAGTFHLSVWSAASPSSSHSHESHLLFRVTSAAASDDASEWVKAAADWHCAAPASDDSHLGGLEAGEGGTVGVDGSGAAEAAAIGVRSPTAPPPVALPADIAVVPSSHAGFPSLLRTWGPAAHFTAGAADADTSQHTFTNLESRVEALFVVEPECLVAVMERQVGPGSTTCRVVRRHASA